MSAIDIYEQRKIKPLGRKAKMEQTVLEPLSEFDMAAKPKRGGKRKVVFENEAKSEPKAKRTRKRAPMSDGDKSAFAEKMKKAKEAKRQAKRSPVEEVKKLPVQTSNSKLFKKPSKATLEAFRVAMARRFAGKSLPANNEPKAQLPKDPEATGEKDLLGASLPNQPEPQDNPCLINNQNVDKDGISRIDVQRMPATSDFMTDSNAQMGQDTIAEIGWEPLLNNFNETNPPFNAMHKNQKVENATTYGLPKDDTTDYLAYNTNNVCPADMIMFL